MYTIILFGKDGMIGNYIYKYFSKQLDKYDVYGFNRKDLDVRNITYEQLSIFLDKYIKKESINVVINAVGLILPVKNTNVIDNITINSIFPNLLSIYCKFNNIHFIHFSTICVFDGQKGNYIETDEPTGKDIYGISKALGDPKFGTVIRTSFIGEELKHKYSLVEWVKLNKNKTINGYTNHLWNGITCLELCKIIKEIIENNLFWNGIRHIYTNSVTKYELVKYINEIYNLNINIIPFNTEFSVDRTLKSIYQLPFKIGDIISQIRELKEFDIN